MPKVHPLELEWLQELPLASIDRPSFPRPYALSIVAVQYVTKGIIPSWAWMISLLTRWAGLLPLIAFLTLTWSITCPRSWKVCSTCSVTATLTLDRRRTKRCPTFWGELFFSPLPLYRTCFRCCNCVFSFYVYEYWPVREVHLSPLRSCKMAALQLFQFHFISEGKVQLFFLHSLVSGFDFLPRTDPYHESVFTYGKGKGFVRMELRNFADFSDWCQL